MNLSVGTTPEAVPVKVGQTPVVQNLGPGKLYLDFDEGVSAASGLQLAVGTVYEFARDVSGTLYAVADLEGTDVRILVVG